MRGGLSSNMHRTRLVAELMIGVGPSRPRHPFLLLRCHLLSSSLDGPRSLFFAHFCKLRCQDKFLLLGWIIKCISFSFF